jgi:hypothetical protein
MKEDKEVVVKNDIPAKDYSRNIEISKEAQEERLLLSGMLLQQTEDLVEKAQRRRKKKQEESIELLSGAKISIAEINAFLSANMQPYSPRFPNNIPFFSEIFRLNGWKHLDPKTFVKPPVVATWINEIIYSRFSKDMPPALRILNPALPNGIRLHKHFQFLTEEGQMKLDQYRDEAIRLMKTCTTWYEFRQKLFQEHAVPYQSSLFE